MNNFSCTNTLKSYPILNFSSGTMLHVLFFFVFKGSFQFIQGTATNSLSDRLNCYLVHSSALLSRALTDNIVAIKSTNGNMRRYKEKAQSEKDSHSKTRGGKTLN